MQLTAFPSSVLQRFNKYIPLHKHHTSVFCSQQRSPELVHSATIRGGEGVTDNGPTSEAAGSPPWQLMGRVVQEGNIGLNQSQQLMLKHAEAARLCGVHEQEFQLRLQVLDECRT